MNDPRLWELAVDCIENSRPCAVLVVVATEGSGPGRPGAAMVVTSTGGSVGTVGGGTMELVLRTRALEMLGNGIPGPELVRHLHSEHGDPGDGRPSGMICSGSQLTAIMPLTPVQAPAIQKAVSLLGSGEQGQVILGPGGLSVEAGPPAKPGLVRGDRKDWSFTWPLGLEETVYVIGGGHVGQALAELLSRLPFRPVVLDDRLSPGQDLPYTWRTVPFREAHSLIPPGDHSWVVVMTPSHSADREILRTISGMSLRYVGLMASRSKKDSIFDDLRGSGVEEEWLEGIRCPIGLPIGGKSPWEIAVSVAAQLLSELKF